MYLKWKLLCVCSFYFFILNFNLCFTQHNLLIKAIVSQSVIYSGGKSTEKTYSSKSTITFQKM